ncbi:MULTISPECIES: LacI family DNA-binding transcriptional regulator [unclassified Oceanispirochaeta]|uniref:LacI family DNA-binding transcriptional regulator n=1 Tax=unclassified Oceanispirochaeta TaxID=2635722 RepID=UPI000E08EA19|nr:MULTISPECIES: LacI family DNA-binding transcriptional regulator [unclassified Oceanispirochaeta]MBF9016551.1 LacI family DNA-binding transcriptional regulator [Oceanispirochaeta sp. M2]NPD73013.1 LacI family transcriptional regulator [Oceanispirochaeta sp. M1]RDG31358.1 LacI family transcriptional regulator [Oceanispirochaeta sp. M1]
MKERITTKKLAAICNVSLGTVDRALNNRYGISPKTRDLILQKAKEYEYTPNHIGRSLQSGKTSDIGVIVHDLDNRFFSQLVNSIQQAAWERGFYIQLAVTLRDPQRERIILEHMVERNMDGILLFPAGKGSDLDDYLQSLVQPVICMGNKISENCRSSLIGLDDRNILFSTASTLAENGYDNFLFVAPFIDESEGMNNYETDERFKGFSEALIEKGLPWQYLKNWNYLQDIVRIIQGNQKTAVVCSSDIYALEVLKHLKNKGIHIPEDVGVMGFDNLDILTYVEPALATIHYPVKEMGMTAVELLLDRISNPEQAVQNIFVPAEILWRESI